VALFRFGLKTFIKYEQQSVESSLIMGLLTGLVVLGTVNATTPYLNHPLGIGYLLLTTAIFLTLYNESPNIIIEKGND
jgi:hypothetical protein